MSAEFLTYLATAEEAARAVGGLLRANSGQTLNVDAMEAYDIKLELDRRAQALIEGFILEKFPHHAIFGEEGIRGDQSSEFQWIVDPIDGTVNYFYGIPHFCISIALRQAGKMIIGLIYDPSRDELWTATVDGPALLNGRPIRVSSRTQLADCTVSIGFSKSASAIDKGMKLFERMVRSAKKCRMQGSAALDLVYVATARLDAYIESQISLWDFAAGMLILERAGGRFQMTELPDNPGKFAVVASSGNVDLGL